MPVLSSVQRRWQSSPIHVISVSVKYVTVEEVFRMVPGITGLAVAEFLYLYMGIITILTFYDAYEY